MLAVVFRTNKIRTKAAVLPHSGGKGAVEIQSHSWAVRGFPHQLLGSFPLWFSPDAAFPRSTVWMSRSNAVGSTFHYVKMDTKHQNLIFAPSYLISSPLQSSENLLLGSVGFLLWNLRHESFLDTFGFVSCKNLLKLPLPMFGLCLCRSSSRFILWIKSWPLWITEFSSRHTSLGSALTCRNAEEYFIADIVQEAASPFLVL